MTGHELGEASPNGGLERLVESTAALRELLGAYSSHDSLSDILADLRTHSEIILEEMDKISLRMKYAFALSVLLEQYEGSTTLVEILEDIRRKTPSIESENGEYSREIEDPRYLRKAGNAWVDEIDGMVIAAGMKFNASPLLKRKPGISKIVWQLIGVSEDGRTVQLMSVRYNQETYIEGSGTVDEVPYGVFRDMYIAFPNS